MALLSREILRAGACSASVRSRPPASTQTTCVLCTCFEAFNRDNRMVLMEDVCANMNGADYRAAAVKLIEATLGWMVKPDAVVAACQSEVAA